MQVVHKHAVAFAEALSEDGKTHPTRAATTEGFVSLSHPTDQIQRGALPFSPQNAKTSPPALPLSPHSVMRPDLGTLHSMPDTRFETPFKMSTSQAETTNQATFGTQKAAMCIHTGTPYGVPSSGPILAVQPPHEMEKSEHLIRPDSLQEPHMQEVYIRMQTPHGTESPAAVVHEGLTQHAMFEAHSVHEGGTPHAIFEAHNASPGPRPLAQSSRTSEATRSSAQMPPQPLVSGESYTGMPLPVPSFGAHLFLRIAPLLLRFKILAHILARRRCAHYHQFLRSLINAPSQACTTCTLRVLPAATTHHLRERPSDRSCRYSRRMPPFRVSLKQHAHSLLSVSRNQT